MRFDQAEHAGIALQREDRLTLPHHRVDALVERKVRVRHLDERLDPFGLHLDHRDTKIVPDDLHTM
jgi:hypothetical protein